MSTVVLDSQSVHIPPWVVDLRSFRDWFHSDEFPEAGRICFFDGEVWVDMTKEQLFTHNQVKGEFAIVLGGFAKEKAFGMFFGDGLHLVNDQAGISGQPDGTFVSGKSLANGRARFVEGAREGYVELIGSPDMVLEVVSASSVTKDPVVLPEAYWQAGIKEYWLVDARQAPLHFDIYRYAPKGYVSARKQAGWIKSTVFGKSFRLTQQSGIGGFPEYTLAVR